MILPSWRRALTSKDVQVFFVVQTESWTAAQKVVNDMSAVKADSTSFVGKLVTYLRAANVNFIPGFGCRVPALPSVVHPLTPMPTSMPTPAAVVLDRPGTIWLFSSLTLVSLMCMCFCWQRRSKAAMKANANGVVKPLNVSYMGIMPAAAAAKSAEL
jgi:hypothetical protein